MLNVGPGFDDGVSRGPQIDQAARDKVEEHVADAKSKGAKVALGGARDERGGTFYQPTVLTGVTTQMKVTREETFGPVEQLFRFKTEEEGVALANDPESGLAAYFSARHLRRERRGGLYRTQIRVQGDDGCP